MILTIVSKLCWSIRYVSLAALNFVHDVCRHEYSAPLHYCILVVAILLPFLALLLWCCLAFDEWWTEEAPRDYWRRVLSEAEDARKWEEIERMDRKER